MKNKIKENLYIGILFSSLISMVILLSLHMYDNTFGQFKNIEKKDFIELKKLIEESNCQLPKKMIENKENISKGFARSVAMQLVLCKKYDIK